MVRSHIEILCSLKASVSEEFLITWKHYLHDNGK